MQQTPVTILAKTPVFGLQVNLARSGLCIGDNAEVILDDFGRVVVSAPVRQRLLGLLPLTRARPLGHLGPVVDRIIGPMIEEGRDLRVRIVGITPEHLSGQRGPELFVSVWGTP